MSEINFNQLKRLWNLKLVTETGSIKKAAVRANVTSSALSQSISGLENELGRKLLIRNKEKLLPTEHGIRLLRDADSAFSACFDLQQRLSGTCSFVPKMTWLDFAASESLAFDVLPKLMQSLRLQLPHLRLKVKSGRSRALTALVRKAELCMALVEENDFMDGVTVTPIAEDRLGFFCSSHESIARLGNKVFDKLGVAVTAAGSEGHSLYFSKFIRTLGSGFKPTLTSESYEILRAAAVEGSVVSVLPTRVAKRKPYELVELFPSKEAEKFASQSYKLCLISEPGCSSEENEFLANEIRSIVSAT
jgi:DNA-binding transcriptional LysR family regulator